MPVSRRIGLFIHLIIVFSMTTLVAQSIPPPKYLTDEEQIHILLHRIEQGIKDQDILAITDCFARVYNIGDTTTARFLLWERLQGTFRGAERRRDDSLFQKLTPAGTHLTSTWDFEMEIDTLRILDDRHALAKVRIFLGAAAPDSKSAWEFGKKETETIILEKINNEWRIKRVHELIRLIEGFSFKQRQR